MELKIVITIARRELNEALKNRWLIGFGGGFALLALALSRAGVATAGYAGLGGFGRTAASLINALLLFVPLLGLTAGASAIAGDRERGSLLYMLAQPISRAELFAGKVIGVTLALMVALLFGFGVAAMALAGASGGHAGSFLSLALQTLLLALTSLAIGFVISVFSRKNATALGAALIVWLLLVFAGDLGLVGLSVSFHPAPRTLLALLLINPLQLFKLGAIYGLRSTLDTLGAVGQYAAYEWGAALPWILVGLLSLYILLGFGIAMRFFTRRNDP